MCSHEFISAEGGAYEVLVQSSCQKVMRLVFWSEIIEQETLTLRDSYYAVLYDM